MVSWATLAQILMVQHYKAYYKLRFSNNAYCDAKFVVWSHFVTGPFMF